MLAMMILGIALLLAFLLAARWYVEAKPSDLIQALKWVALTLVTVFVVWLALTGKLWAAVAAVPAILAWFVRLFTGLRYAQMFRRMMGGAMGGGEQRQHQSQSARPSGAMSREEALRVLGLQEGASRDDIKAAHRHLMSQVHPDKGGTDYLAQQINQAKDVLLDQ